MSSKMTKEEFVATHLVENSYPNTKIRKPLLEFGLKENKCEICGISEWNGNPLTCQLHHINGNRTDNRLENLQMLCPNCHSQTENYMNKNTFIYNEKAKVCVNCGKPFVAKSDNQKFCSSKCLNDYNSRHQRTKMPSYSKEFLQELCGKYNTLDEIGFIIHKTRATVKRYLIQYGLFEDFKRKRNFHSTPVIQYDSEGNFIKEWPSILDAQETLKIHHIGMVCAGKRKSAGGYLWSYKNVDILNNEEVKQAEDHIPVPTNILQYNIDGIFIKEYKTVEEAFIATGINKSSIINCMQDRRKQAGGFIWKHKEGPIPYQIEVPSFDYVDTTPVKMLDINGNLIREFPSIVAAAKYMNTSTSNILHCLRGDTESSCGYIWRYKKYSKTPLAEEIFNRSLPDTIFLSKVRVLQYDLDGKFIKEYESMALASEATGINHSHIAQCTYGDRDRAGDYMWKTKEDENFPLQIAPYKEKPRRSRPILQYDRCGNFVREFQTIEEILNVYNVSRGTIMKCLSDSKKSFAGYVWRDKEENIPQTIDVSDIIFDSKWNVPVQKYDLEGNLIQEYPSIFAASKACGVSRTYIKNSIEGHSRKIDNCVWKYAQ